MRTEHHLALSAGGGAVLYVFVRSVPMSAAFVVAGVLLDVDHWVDYWAEYGRRFDVRHFFQAVSQKKFHRAFLLLHAWEWVLLCAALTRWSRWNPWLAGLTLGWGLHMLLDQVCNATRPWTYSLLWRWAGRFNYKRSFPVPYVPREPKP